MNVSPGIEHHPIVGDFRDGAARRDREHPRAAAAAQPGVDLVAVHQRAAAAAPRREAVRVIATTASKLDRVSARYGHARVTSANSSSSP